MPTRPRPRPRSLPRNPEHRRTPQREGWEGWDTYAPFYDWENARTLGRRDVAFWQRIAATARGRVLELGCGTGRISLPLARAGVPIVGIDRSQPMLDRARLRARRRSPGGSRHGLHLVRGDIRHLPFEARSFAMVLAPYGILQSLVRDDDLTATLASVAGTIRPGGLFGIDLVPDVPNWKEYENRVQMRGRARGAHLTLVETVQQDRRRHLTMFDQTYIERRGKATREHRFQLTFRTLTIPQMIEKLDEAGFAVEAVLGDYRGKPIDLRSDVWLILATRKPEERTRRSPHRAGRAGR